MSPETIKMGGAVLENTSEAVTRNVVLSRFNEAKPGLKISEVIIDRLALSHEHSNFFLDSMMIESALSNILSEISAHDPGYKLSQAHLSEARVAALIHDVGKSGPLNATFEQQLAVLRLFAEETLRHPKQIVEEGVREAFGDEADSILDKLKGCGINVAKTMKDFWESHARWGYEIIQKYGGELSENTRSIAISHHMDKGEAFNFLGLPIDQIPKASLLIGGLENYVDILRQRTIIAVDQYEAQIRRSKATHEDAVLWVRTNLSKTFGNDAFMNLVLDTMLKMGKDKIFGSMAKAL